MEIVLLVVISVVDFLLIPTKDRKTVICFFCLFGVGCLIGWFHLFLLWMIPLWVLLEDLLFRSGVNKGLRNTLLLVKCFYLLFSTIVFLCAPKAAGTSLIMILSGLYVLAWLFGRKLALIPSVQPTLDLFQKTEIVKKYGSGILFVVLALLQTLVFQSSDHAPAVTAFLLFLFTWIFATSFHQEQEKVLIQQESLTETYTVLTNYCQEMGQRQNQINQRMHDFKNSLLLIRDKTHEEETKQQIEKLLNESQECFLPVYSSDLFLDFLLSQKIGEISEQGHDPILFMDVIQTDFWTGEQMLKLAQIVELIFSKGIVSELHFKLDKTMVTVNVKYLEGGLLNREEPVRMITGESEDLFLTYSTLLSEMADQGSGYFKEERNELQLSLFLQEEARG